MIDEEKAAGLWASDDANCVGATGLDLGGQLLLGEWVVLPLGLVRAFGMTDSDITPGCWQVV
jgi:hypothetical protein